MERYKEYLGKSTIAYELIKQLEENGLVLSAPVDIEEIYKYLSIIYKAEPNFTKINITGSITILDGRPNVWINPLKNPQVERKRFTLAHELGHFMLHIAPNGVRFIEDENISFNRDDNWSLQEKEANNFAAQLLMPAKLIEEKIKDFDSRPSLEDAIAYLAPIFNVSTSAMAFRLNNLGFEK